MKTFLFICLWCVISCSAYAAGRLGLHYRLDDESNRRIHQFVREIVPTIEYDNNRHIGVGWIEGVSDEQRTLIRHSLCEAVREEGVSFTPERVDRLLMRGRGHTHTRCPLVLYPTAEGMEAFKRVNRILMQRLEALCTERGFDYQFIEALQPKWYLPHITLLNQNVLQAHDLVNSKDELIRIFNEDQDRLRALSLTILRL